MQETCKYALSVGGLSKCLEGGFAWINYFTFCPSPTDLLTHLLGIKISGIALTFADIMKQNFFHKS